MTRSRRDSFSIRMDRRPVYYVHLNGRRRRTQRFKSPPAVWAVVDARIQIINIASGSDLIGIAISDHVLVVAISTGSMQSLTMRRWYLDVAVLTVTTRTRPSEPGWQ